MIRNELYLSPIYKNRSLGWVIVYHTRSAHDGEVEILGKEGSFFSSEKDAWDWFHASHKVHEYIQPEAVEVLMMELMIRRPKIEKL